MKLGRYLETQSISHSEFGRRLNVSQATISRYVADDRRPSLAMARKIQAETSGAVTLADFFPEIREMMEENAA